MKISKGIIIEDQGDFEKTLAENYIEKLRGNNPIKIKFLAHPPNVWLATEVPNDVKAGKISTGRLDEVNQILKFVNQNEFHNICGAHLIPSVAKCF